MQSIDLESGEIRERGEKGITECFRVDREGKIIDTKYRLETGESRMARHDRDDEDALAVRAHLVATPEHRVSRCKQRSNGISANSVVNSAPRRLRPSGSRAAGRLAVRR
jgi:hypothetical protein